MSVDMEAMLLKCLLLGGTGEWVLSKLDSPNGENKVGYEKIGVCMQKVLYRKI